MLLFALQASRAQGERIAAELGIELAPHEERDFADGEHSARPLVSVRRRDVFVLQSLYADDTLGTDAKLNRLLFFCGAVHDAGAARVVAVTPYLCCTRQDRRSRPREPLSLRYVASMMEAVGVDHLVALDVHNPAALENALRRPVDHLECRHLFVERLAPLLTGSRVTVVSPDLGGAKRAERYRQALATALGEPVESAVVTKQRDGALHGAALVIGQVEARVAVIVDDMIDSGATLVRAALACRARGAAPILAVATHALLTGEASRRIADSPVEHLLVADTVEPRRAASMARTTVVPTAPLLAEALRRIHAGSSVSELG